ncbi:MAG: efflux RND transporter periplasmic adaptor subunit [Candidatus Binatia bacterium]
MRDSVAILRRKTTWGVVLAGVALVIVVLRPEPIPVDVARVERGRLQVTIDEEGETRVRDRFVVAAPVGGRTDRIEFDEGDPIEVNQVLTAIAPFPLGAREREEQRARVAAAEALQSEAEAEVRRAQAEFEQAQRDRVRAETLVKKGYVAQQAAERDRMAETTKANELKAARFKAQSTASEVALARAGLMALDGRNGKEENLILVRSPVTGRVLRVTEKSVRVVTAGTPLMTVGDPTQLEVVVDILSTDAVQVQAGMPVLLEHWGGERSLRARVRTVEPAAFTKISALGVEEQRVNVIIDFVDPSGSLGDGYRVETRIIIWEQNDVVKAPASALFRHGQTWGVFVIDAGRARVRAVEVGHRNALEAEMLSGVNEGEEVVRHPSNQLEDGVRVVAKG